MADELILVIRGTGYGGVVSGRGGDTFAAKKSRQEPFTQSVEFIEEPGGLFWGPKIGNGYLTDADYRSATSVGVKTSGLRNARPGMGEYVLVKANRR